MARASRAAALRGWGSQKSCLVAQLQVLLSVGGRGEFGGATNGERREVSETRNTGRSGQGGEVSGCAWDIGTRLCSSKGDSVWSLSTPLPTPPPKELQTGEG